MAGKRSTSGGIGRVGLVKRGRFWHARFTVEGRRHDVSLKVTAKPIAERLAVQISDAIERGTPWEHTLGRSRAGEKTFDELADEWSDKACRWSPLRRIRCAGTIRRLKTEFNKPVSRITRHDVEAFLSRLRAAGAKPATVTHYLAAIKVIFAAGEEWGHVASNPAAGIRGPSVDRKLPRPYHDDEIERLRQVLAPDRVDVMVMFLETALRLNELRCLGWKDVSFENDEITIRAAKGGGDRVVPMSANVKAILRRWHRQRVTAPVVPIDDRIFGDGANIYKPLVRAFKVAGIDPQRAAWLRPIHSLRDTALTNLVRAGVPLDRVRLIAGHRDIAMTLRYSHTSNESLHEAVAQAFNRG